MFYSNVFILVSIICMCICQCDDVQMVNVYYRERDRDRYCRNMPSVLQVSSFLSDALYLYRGQGIKTSDPHNMGAGNSSPSEQQQVLVIFNLLSR